MKDNLYNIENWGAGYFRANERGNVEVTQDGTQVEIQEIVKSASKAGLQLPLLIRFPAILHDRVNKLYEAFDLAITEQEYSRNYKLIYPIKVNQQQYVVREILNSGRDVGLEAGSKPELIAAIGSLGKEPSTIVCNGYKDASYIRMALIAQQMGHKVYIVIEETEDLDIILREAAAMQVTPVLGFRVKINAQCEGKWAASTGATSKFGVRVENILKMVETLKSRDMLDCVQLLHCHFGSQVTNIHGVRDCMLEVTRFYLELRKLGLPIGVVDVGGGLGVDYEGTHSNTQSSINYTIEEYAMNILIPLKLICQDEGVPEPDIFSESGRAITAHHALLVSNLHIVARDEEADKIPKIPTDASYVIKDIWDTYQTMSECSSTEIYNYAMHSLNDAQGMFKHGTISLSELAIVEQLFKILCFAARDKLDLTDQADSALNDEINKRFASRLFMNMSIFQSLPDSWAINQIFPVIPTTHLNEPKTLHGVLHDITCDSDGKIHEYAGGQAAQGTLLLPEYSDNDPYNIAFFLVGAYQEILGNLHNLFGDTNSLDVRLSGENNFEIDDLTTGDTIANVLAYANYDGKKIIQSCEKQLLSTDLSEDQISAYINELRSAVTQLTYLQIKKIRVENGTK